MAYTLKIKPVLTKRVARKVRDNIPEQGASCESNLSGPPKKNLVLPKALAPTLSRNVNIGNA